MDLSGLSEYGCDMIEPFFGSAAMASIMARPESMVPPLAPPLRLATRVTSVRSPVLSATLRL